MSEERTILVDASVFITLAEVDALPQLKNLRGETGMPPTVGREIVRDPAATKLEHAAAREPRWLGTNRRPEENYIEQAAAHLGRDGVPDDLDGDVALLAHAPSVEDPIVLTDDKPLRQTCKALSIPVSGSIGVLIRAVERGDLDADEAKAKLEAMDEVGARLSASLYRRAERMIDEAAED